MRQRKKRMRLSRQQRRDHPRCVYCGGDAAAEQVDHVPPKAMFAMKRRPEGLEFSACAACHKGTRNIDAVAALTARAWPNLSSEDEREELQSLMHGVLRNVPVVRDELARGFGTNGAVPDDIAGVVGRDVVVMDFTVRRTILDAFGARIGMALYYKLTGQVLSEAGGVWVRTYSNVENIRGEALPPELDGALGAPLALIQKGLRAEDDFQYAMRLLDDYSGTLCFAAFRQSFATLAVAYPDVAGFPPPMREDLFRPGFLIGFPV